METDHALPAPWPHRLCDETLQKGREASFAAFELSNPPTIVRLHLLSFTWTSPCTIDERAHTEPPSDQSAFPISPVIRNALSLKTPIADLERLDLTLIELAYRPSALCKKGIFPASQNQRALHSPIEPFRGLAHAAVLQTFMAEGEGFEPPVGSHPQQFSSSLLFPIETEV